MPCDDPHTHELARYHVHAQLALPRIDLTAAGADGGLYEEPNPSILRPV